MKLDGEDVYWLESHPLEGGRYTVMHMAKDGKIVECTPPEYYVRTTVHEYGGGAYTVADGTIYFANFGDQHLYRQGPDARPQVLTPGPGYRYADLIPDRGRKRLVCIREDHTGHGEAVNTIVGVSMDGGDNGTVLVGGNDFYSSPRLSPDGSQLAYLTWNHPNMPWDGCELWLAELGSDGNPGSARLIAGSQTESIFQPEWSPDGTLYFVAEHTGWWNLYRWQDGRVQALCPMEAEFGTPQWQFGMSTFAFASDSRMLCCYSEDGLDHLAWLDTRGGALSPVASRYTDVGSVRGGGGRAFFIAGSPTDPPALFQLEAGQEDPHVIQRAFDPDVDPGYLSVAEPITFRTTNEQDAHAIYYPPRNKDFAAAPGERPPLLVMCHGGPTSAAGTALRYAIQFWTSRGFAAVDVNYGGSTGYGRAYRRRLNGQWGIVDVDDCCNAARHLVQAGLADGERLAIRGGSAGGYTTLACLVFRNDVFAAGASYYGLAELERFAVDTHKFEFAVLELTRWAVSREKGSVFRAVSDPLHGSTVGAVDLVSGE